MGIISGRLFLDQGDGVETAGDDGIAGVTVQLVAPPVHPFAAVNIATTTTDADGNYSFNIATAANYYVQFDSASDNLPDGAYVAADQGSDDTIDSDVDSFGRSSVFYGGGGINVSNIDAGIVAPDGVVDGASTAENMTVGFTDLEGDQITNAADSIHAGAGNDTIASGGGNDTISGGDGDDNIEYGAGDNFVSGGDGNDTIDDQIGTTITGNNVIDGGAGNDLIFSSDGANQIDGGTGSDVVIGGSGADTIIGGGDGDTISGGQGDDVITGDAAPGTYVVQVFEFGTSYTGNADNFPGSNFAGIQITGTPSEIVFIDDDSVLDNDDVSEEFAANDATQTVRVNGEDFPANIEGQVTLTGSDGLTYTFAQVQVDLNRNDLADDTGGEEATFLIPIGDVPPPGVTMVTQIGSDFTSDLQYLDIGAQPVDGNDSLEGNAGDDQILSGGGADTVIGGGGADTIEGGAGDDIITGDNASAVLDGERLNNGNFDGNLNGWSVLNPSGGAAPALFGADSDVFINNRQEAAGGDGIEQVFSATVGEPYIATIQASANGTEDHTVLIELIDSNGTVIATRTEVIEGATETLDVSFVPTTATIALRITNPSSTGTVNSDLIIESASVTIDPAALPGDDSLSGGAGSDVIDGGAGNDIIDGGDDGDGIDGGTGNDTISGGAGNDDIDAQAGDDLVFGGDGDDTINGEGFGGGTGNDTVDGGAGNDRVSGDAGNDQVFGGTGDDSLSGEDGTDSLFGGAGNDNLFQAGGGNADDGTGDLYVGGSGTDTVSGGSGDDTIYGDFADTPVGTNTNNTEFNTLFLGNFADIDTDESTFPTENEASLLGTYGAADSPLGADVVRVSTVDADGDGVVETDNDPSLGAFTDNGDNEGWNINGSLQPIDSLVFYNTTITYKDGSTATSTAGVVQLVNGDTHLVPGSFGEYSAAPIQSVSLDSVLGDNFALGTTSPDVTFQTPTTGAADSLSGGAGDDTIDGGAGNDTVTGGTGDDTFVETAGDGADVITDFNVGNTGSLDDGDQTNNDFVDLSGFYTRDAVDAIEALGTDNFAHELDLLRADVADGRLDGIVGGVDYSAQIGDVDLSLQNGGAAVTGNDLTFDNTNVACFLAGTFIEAPTGDVRIEDLAVGDEVVTVDRGNRPVAWIGCSNVSEAQLSASPNLRPIRIKAGALGLNRPTHDLYVSPQHRVLVRSKIAERMSNSKEVLVAAKKLLELPGVEICNEVTKVEYIHLMFDNHELILSNGTQTESFYPGCQALNAQERQTRQEIFELFPQLKVSGSSWKFARPVFSGKRAKNLVYRHVKNQVLIYNETGTGSVSTYRISSRHATGGPNRAVAHAFK